MNVKQKNHSRRDVALIGSGLAGLVAGIRLQAAGWNVTLFEKARGPGGRMSSKRLPAQHEGSADIGAQYFTVRNPEFRRFLEQYAGAQSWGPWQARLRYQDGEGHWQALRPEQRYVGIPRMSAITRGLSRGLDVRSGVRIDHLEKTGQGHWQLVDTDGETHGDYDIVLLTPPPQQTRDLLGASGLEQLVEHTTVRDARMHACWTVVVNFPDGAGASADGYMPKGSRLHWIANNSSKPGREDRGEWWVLHSDPEWTDQNLEMEPDQVCQILISEMREISQANGEIGECVSHLWRYARPVAESGPGHLWFDDLGIGIIGDWLDGGRVEGAFNSASGLVDQLLKDD